MEKCGKILEKCNGDLENAVVCYIVGAFVNFLAVHDTKHLKFNFQKFEYIHCIGNFSI